ncbi:bifunctional oligoribonuclease/PAP phosphatase NrnA [Desulfobulbus rhabdoformis]|jgi:phosphoesterase RecJ-like protein|uniref:DHH family phosphoesterase n=1 Tax=Desulfobulbus rhabdoformis TaxID=34032 RepID=UPI001963AA3E|nr:bifunctional oligoribonuclease/PAP phosphatase NrnA [Desulfobulbus rhabdoformis]MBM9613039.1 bifunctional oligoribonuclease/PAP phosphatase NrnA [Desulfobulbus rhabdoformis]
MSNPDSRVVDAVREKDHILLATHYNPDGDALGSLLGLADILEGMGKTVLRFLEDPVTHLYRFLPGCGQIQTDLAAVRTFVAEAGEDFLALCLDCGEAHRLGRYSEELITFTPMMVIDHHKGNNGFGDGAWIEPHRSSTGEMIFDLAQALGAEISDRAAECLYTAINTDTGSFRYESTSSHTFAVAGELVQRGVRPEVIANQLYDNYTLGRLRLMQEVLATLEMHERDRIAFIRVSQNMLERTFTTMEDTEYFINFPRAVATVRVAVFLKEVEPDHISVSLRAKGQCDVSLIAARFGGGGHKNASGCRFKGQSLDSVRDALLACLRPEVNA